MGMLDTIEKKIGKKAGELAEKAPEKIKDGVKDKVKENVWGYLCTKGFKSEANQNRCKALTRLPDIASSGVKAVGSCGTALGAGAAEVGTGGAATPVAAPVGIASAASCGYNGAKTLDSGQAMVRQIYSGKEVKTLEEQGKEAAGTWIKKKVKDEYDRQVNEVATSDYRHFKELNPDATPADYDRIQQVQDDFDAGQF
jgi:hypothetical protein